MHAVPVRWGVPRVKEQAAACHTVAPWRQLDEDAALRTPAEHLPDTLLRRRHRPERRRGAQPVIMIIPPLRVDKKMLARARWGPARRVLSGIG